MPQDPDLPHPPPVDAGQLSPAALAYVGDAIYTLLVRSLLVGRGPAKQSELHARSVAAVRAPAQARALDRLEAHLTDEERTIVRRARNAHVGRGGGGTGAERHYATGLEALFGYLYLSGRIERLMALFDIIASPAWGFPGGDDGERRAPKTHS
jgi:ribonuclease-3 family protein